MEAYRDERRRQEDAAEHASIGYATEYAEYVAEHPLITFRDWLVMTTTAPADVCPFCTSWAASDVVGLDASPGELAAALDDHLDVCEEAP